MATVNLLAGVGYYFVDYTMADEPREIYAASGVEGLPDQTVSDALGVPRRRGARVRPHRLVQRHGRGPLSVSLRRGVSGTTKDGYELGGSLDLNTWLFTGGIKVAF